MIIKLLRISVLILFAGLAFGKASADVLSVATFLPPQHHTNANVWKWFGDELAKRTDGKLTIKVYPSGQLGAGPVQQYKRVVEGVADLVIGVASYTPELFPKTMLASLPGKATNSLELSDAFIANWDLFKDEYKDVVFLGIGFPTGSSLAARSNMSTLDSWKGKKVVPVGAFMAPLVEAMGAVPVQMPTTDIYTALSTGTIDAAVSAYNTMLKPWNWQEVSSYFIDNIPPEFQTVIFLMNKDRYLALPDDQRAAIDALAGEVFTKVASSSFHQNDVSALKKMKSQEMRFEFITVSDEERARMNTATEAGIGEVFSRYSKKMGIPNAREIYNALQGSR